MEVWEIQLTLTYPILDGDTKKQYEGDAEVDYSRRSLERVREHLDKLLKTSPFEHYHITNLPERKWD